MKDGKQDKKAIDLKELRVALSSSSTKQRGAWLANLHQHVLDSGKTQCSRYIYAWI